MHHVKFCFFSANLVTKCDCNSSPVLKVNNCLGQVVLKVAGGRWSWGWGMESLGVGQNVVS